MTQDFVLIDPPITPYSSREDVSRWADVCRRAVSDNPGSAEWQEALAYAEGVLAEITEPIAR